VAVIVEHRYPGAIHPMHAILLAGALPLFAGALLSDIAYARSYEIQWNNFASWLIAGGLVLAGIALVFAVAGLVRRDRRSGTRIVYVLALVAAWIVQLLNALMHARDAWAGMPEGLVLSAIGTALAALAVWLGFWALRFGAPA
jgi:uncharacterized membrane protein